MHLLRTERMNTFEKISGSITEHIPEVLQRFNVVTEQDPWIHLPADYRVNCLGEVIEMAATLALRAPGDRTLCTRMLHSAADHGQTRLKQGLPDSILFRELYMVRESLWSYMKEEHAEDSAMVAEAIVRVDTVLSLASKASLRGYHRPTFEERGTWPKVIDELVGEWNPPPPVHEILKPAETVV